MAGRGMEVMYTYIQIREYLTNEMWLNSWRFFGGGNRVFVT